MEFGAFYPFSRNHNTDNGIDQDPVSLGPEVVESAKQALSIRYALLPYLYSLFVKSHLFGNPVVTPMFFHAKPGDEIAYFIDDQMFWGSDLLIAPALSENQNQVQAYLPSGTCWYDLRSLKKIQIDNYKWDFLKRVNVMPSPSAYWIFFPKVQYVIHNL